MDKEQKKKAKEQWLEKLRTRDTYQYPPFQTRHTWPSVWYPRQPPAQSVLDGIPLEEKERNYTLPINRSYITSYQASIALKCTMHEVEEQIISGAIDGQYIEEKGFEYVRWNLGKTGPRPIAYNYWIVFNPEIIEAYQAIQEEKG